MAKIKKLEEGNLVAIDKFNGATNYDSLELYSENDEVSSNDLNRPIKNIYESVSDINYITDKISLTIGLKNGVFLNDFEFDVNTDIKTILVKNASNTVIRKHFLRVTPGGSIFKWK